MTHPTCRVKLQVFQVFALVVDWVLGGCRLSKRQDTSSRDQTLPMCQSNLRTLPIDLSCDLWDSIGVEGNTHHPMITNILQSLPQFILEMDADWEMVCDFVLSQDKSLSESQWLAVEKVFLEEIDA